MGFLKIIQKPFQNHWYEYISKTLKLESTQDLKFHKHTKNSIDLTKLDTNWTKICWNTYTLLPISTHIVTRIQFSFQLISRCIIHCAQGLTFDCLTFDPFNVIKHDLTYTILSCIYLKEHSYYFPHYQIKISM
jgi:hypothetical protein